MSSDANSKRPRSTTAKPNSSSALAAKHVLQQHANRLQSRFATEKAQQPLQTAPSMPPAAQAADSMQQPSSSLGSASVQQPRQQAQGITQDRGTEAQAGVGAVSSYMTQPEDQGTAISTSGRTSPGNLQLPFRQSPSALTPGPLQPALPSGSINTQRQQPGMTHSTASSASDVPASVQSLQRLSLKDWANSLRGGTVGKRLMSAQVSAHTSIDSPEKQELGRRKCLIGFFRAWAAIIC